MPSLIRTFHRTSICLTLVLLPWAEHAHAQGVVPTMGKEFWLGFMENYQGNPTNSLDIFISSPVATSGTVTLPLLGWSQNFVVAPNVTTTVTVPTLGATGTMHFNSDVVDNKAILIQTQDTVAVFAINFESYTADGTTVYPIQSLGTSYRLQAYQGYPGINDLVSEFLIVANKDGTEVEINSTSTTGGGHLANVPWTVQLDSGETYQVKASAPAGDFTGTTIIGTPASGSCRPFSVYSGSLCTVIPAGCTACDHIMEQDLPTNVWGTRYYSVPFNSTTQYAYRILADQNNTQVTVNGGAPINLNAGQFVEVNNFSQPACFEGNKKFSVAQLMQSQSCAGGTGDPALLILNAEEQQINNITFATVVSTVITNHSVNIVTETANTNQVSLDGSLVPAASFTPYTACPTQSYAVLPLTTGSHTLSCPGGLSAYVYGTGSAESYAYSVGSFTPLPPILIDSVFCGLDSTGTLTLAPPNPVFDPFWTTVSDPNDTLHFGLSYTFTPPASDIYVVTGYENLSQCEEQYFFSVEIDSPPDLVTTANGVPSPLSISICAHEQVQLNVIPDPPGTYLYNWWPDPELNDGSLQDPIATPTRSGYFYVSVSTLNGCAVAVDSVYIQVVGGDVLVYDAGTQQDGLCLGDSSQLSLTVHQIIAQDTLDGSLGAIWSNVQGGVISNACGSVYGDALYFDGANPRQATTNGLDVSAGGTVSFAIHIGAGAPPCDDADPGEDVVLEYSTNGGGTWTNIATYWEYLYPNFTTINVPIPPGAQTANTMFRWRQLSSNGPGNDNWAIDNVAIAVEDPTGLSFNWTPAATLSDGTVQDPMAYPTSTGWYSVESIDSQTQCTYQDSVYIEVDAPFSIAITPDTAICDIAGIQLEAVPSSGSNHTWLWTPGATLSADFIEDPVATPVSTTTYHVTVTTGFGCVATDSVTVTISGALGLTITTPDDDLCQGESTLLDATIQGSTTNLTYSWSPAASLDDATIQDPTATPLTTTDYVLTVTDTITGCQLVEDIVINVSTAYVVTATADTTLCDPVGFQLSTVHNVPNPQISWTPANHLTNANTATPTITFDSTMQYIVVVQDAMGCSARDTVNITVPFDDLTFFADSSLCAGDAMVIDAGYPGSTYAWSPNGETTQSITVTTADDYTVVITDQNGCQATFTTAVTVDPLPVVVLGPDTSLCIGQVYMLDAGNPGSAFTWSTTEQTQTIQVSTDATYWVEVLDANDCANRDSVDVVFDPLPVIDLHDTIVCISETVTLDAENPGSWYLWSTGATTRTVALDSVSGTYSVVVTTPTFCVDSADAQITFIDFPIVDLGPDSALCDRDTMPLDLGNPGQSYLWSNGSTDQETYFTDDAEVWGQVFNGYCTTRDSVTLVFHPLPDEIAEALRVVCLDVPPNKTLLDAGNPGCTYLWNTNETTQMIEADAYGWYIVDITTPLHCSITDSVYIQEYCPPVCYIPNSFTPDGDGVNDIFAPSGYNIATMQLMIFDRWGELIYSGADGDAAWDGTRGGTNVQDGVYVWKVKYRFFEDYRGTMGPEQEQVGHVTLLR